MEKFGFPFIMAIRGKNKHQIYRAMETRILLPKAVEFQNALTEIYQIAWLRLVERISQ
jgi:2-oxo-4-hydroxy-4-carboxy-5-ureidoimidazoline decarboxylase